MYKKLYIYAYDDPVGMATRRGGPIRLSSLLTPSVMYAPGVMVHMRVRAGRHAFIHLHLETIWLSAPIIYML